MGLMGLPDCNSHCLEKFGFAVTVHPASCEQNFHMSDTKDEASCTDPEMGGVNSSMGGIAGCSYHPPASEMPAMCSTPVCPMTVGWPQLGPLEVEGKAYAGGLGHQMVTNATHEYGVWTCLRDWNLDEQLRCGAKPLELACFWFDEKSRMWTFRGTNDHARLVERNRYEHGLDYEEAQLLPHILIPRPRKLGILME